MADDESSALGDEDIVTDRQFYVKVDRSSKDERLVEYLRLGTPADDAMYDSTETVEEHAKKAFIEGESLSEIQAEIAEEGTLLYTSGDKTEMVDGNSFTRTVGEAYHIYGEKHEFVDSANVVSGASKGLFGSGLEYSVSRAVEYSASASAKLEFAAGATYGSNLSASFESKTGIGLGLFLGGNVEVAHGLKAEFNAKGEFEAPSSGLNHSEKPAYFGEDSITLGLDEDPIHGSLKTALKTLAGLIQAADLAYTANGIATVARLGDIRKNPDGVDTHVHVAQGIAATQGAIAIVSLIVSLIAYKKQKQTAEAMGGNITDKPYIRIETPTGSQTSDITLDTGGGASIRLSGNSVTIRATTINLETNVAGSEGPISMAAGTNLDLYGTDGVLLSTPQTTTVQAVNGIDLNAGASNITSTAARWTQNGAFQAGQTTLGATTATSLSVTGQPVASAAGVAAVQARVQTLENRIGMTATAAIAGLGTALAGLLM